MADRIPDIVSFIKKARGKASQDDFAAKIGGNYTRRQVSGYERGEMTPPADYVLRAARAAGLSLDELTGLSSGNGLRSKRGSSHDLTPEDMDAYVKVNRYPIEVEAGNGAVPDTNNLTPVDQLTFRRDWLVGTRGLDPHKVGLVFIRGDSMYPTLWPGDLVMVDTTKKRIHGGALYVIRMGEELMAKRLQLVGPEKVRVTSDNSDVYGAYEVSTADMEVVGEIVWYCRDLK